MKIESKIKRFQEGGAMPTGQEGAPAPQGGAPEGGQPGAQQDPLAMLAQLAQEALQSKDPNKAFAVCDGLLQLIQQMIQSQGGGGGNAAPQGEPVYAKKGAKIVKIGFKKKEVSKKC